MSKRTQESEAEHKEDCPLPQKRIRVSEDRPIAQALDLPDEMWIVIFEFVLNERPGIPSSFNQLTRARMKWTCRQWRHCIYALTTQVLVKNIPIPMEERTIQELVLYTNLKKLILTSRVENTGRLLRGLDRRVADGLVTLRLNHSVTIFNCGFQCLWPKDGRFKQLTTLNAADFLLRSDNAIHLPPTLTKLRFRQSPSEIDLSHLIHLRVLDLVRVGNPSNKYKPPPTFVKTDHAIEQLFFTLHGDLTHCYLDYEFGASHTPLELIIRPRERSERANVLQKDDLSAWEPPETSCLTQVKKLSLQHLRFDVFTPILFYKQFKTLELLVEQNVVHVPFTRAPKSRSIEDYRRWGCVHLKQYTGLE